MSGLCKEEYAIHVINLAKTLPSDIHLSTIIHLSVHDQSPQTQALLPTGPPAARTSANQASQTKLPWARRAISPPSSRRINGMFGSHKRRWRGAVLPAQWTQQLFGARAPIGRSAAVCEADPWEARVGRVRTRAREQERDRGRDRDRSREAPRRTHRSAKTTPSEREAIQASDEKNSVLARQYGVDRKTIAKWKGRKFSYDMRMGPKNPRSKFLTLEDEAIILAYRWRARLSLDDSHVRLKRLYPHLTRSALYRCWKRHEFSKIGRTNASPPLTSESLAGPYRFEITDNHVGLDGGDFGFPVLLAVEEVTKHVYGEAAEATPENAVAFLDRLVAEFPQKIDAVTTDIRRAFAHYRGAFGEVVRGWEPGPHPFALACSAHGIIHKRTVLLSRARVSAETVRTHAAGIP